MTNTEIIIKALQEEKGFTDEQIEQLLTAYRGDLPFHTLPVWNKLGYRVKTGESAYLVCELWKYTDKPSEAMKEAAKEAGKDEPESSPHYYKKRCYIFAFSQVEKAPPMPDLETLMQQLQELQGLIIEVKGAKTASQVVWLSGDTTQHKEAIKAIGGQWATKKKAWYIKPRAIA